MRSLLFACCCCIICTTVQAQNINLDPETRKYVGFELNLQSFDLDDLNRQLGIQGYPIFDEGALEISFVSQSRKEGRHVMSGMLNFAAFESGGSIADPIGTGRSSASMGYFGLGGAYGYDLLYPSAWNVLVGAEVGILGGRLTTFRANGFGNGNPQFNNTSSEGKYNWASVYITPTVTLQSVEIAIGKTKSRFTAQVGYRLATDAELSLNGFADQPYSLSLNPSGINFGIGIITVVPTLKELLN